jgi:acyl carrier protein
VADILSQLEPIFRDVLDNPNLRLTREANASNTEGWDSLAHINLISSIEQHFGISFDLGELESLEDVGQMADLMEQKLAAL